MFKKLLIANRGEIACRIIKTARRLSIETVAIYSDADVKALHCQLADVAYRIGGAQSQESYLNIDSIINVAKKAKVDAIHPGYGFLSENPEFAQACQKAGITFVGPPIAAIEAMGSKKTAKSIIEKANIPAIPGYHGDDQSETTFIKHAKKIGFPILLKAAAGGGGKGMRVVHDEKTLKEAFAAAKREAKSSFGDDTLLLEKYLANPRHIEIQIFADQHGNVIHLFERDCSIQRRHQKIIEEAPAPHFSTKLREAMGKAAVKIAKSIDYVGAGTIEFLVDSDQHFYFMEVNTRLQVEHPVTEMITQQDLVEWQLRIAFGEKLPLTQRELPFQGHAIEARIYAEDPANQFLPSIGKVYYFHPPKLDDHTRLDSGIIEGDEISMYYDPMIAKLICWGENRETALATLQHALSQFYIANIIPNIDFLKTIISHSEFQKGLLNTHFIATHEKELFKKSLISNEALAIASLYLLLQQCQENYLDAADKPRHEVLDSDHTYSPWQTKDAWQLNLPSEQILHFIADDQEIKIPVKHLKNAWQLTLSHHQKMNIQGEMGEHGEIKATIDEQSLIHAAVFNFQNQLIIFGLDHRYQLKIYDDINRYTRDEESAGHLTAPMPGAVVAVLTKPGDSVKRGDSLMVIEAMKMEHTIHAPMSGIVKEIYFTVGEQVNEGVELLSMEGI